MLRTFLPSLRKTHHQSNHPRSRLRRLLLEPLEDRLAPALFQVTSFADSGPGTLRAAILEANKTAEDDQIIIDTGGKAATIQLASALPPIEDSHAILIDGMNADLVTIRRNATAAFNIFNVGPKASLELSGITLANGLAENGGAIRNEGLLIIDEVKINENQSTRDGGGIFNLGTLTVHNTEIGKNQAGQSGGAIHNSGELHISNVKINENKAGEFGGAIFNLGSLFMEQDNIVNNSANAGGGIANFGRLDISNVKINENQATIGGGIFNDSSGTLVVARTTIANNSAAGDGGGLFNQGLATIKASTLSGNLAKGKGGAIFNDGELVSQNSTLSGNTANLDAGGLFNNQGRATLTHLTITNNFTVGGVGAGVRVVSGDVVLRNTVVAKNAKGTLTKNVSDDVAGLFSTASASNFIGVVTGASGISSKVNKVGTALAPLDPKLAPLGNNGGATQTHVPLADSPLIDAADLNLSEGLALDQREDGFGRRASDFGLDISIQADIGAIEYQEFLPRIDPRDLDVVGPMSVQLLSNGNLKVKGPTGYGFEIIGEWTRQAQTVDIFGITATRETFVAFGSLQIKTDFGNLPMIIPTGKVAMFATAPDNTDNSGVVSFYNFSAEIDISNAISKLTEKLGFSMTLPNIEWGLSLGNDLGHLSVPLNNAVPYFHVRATGEISITVSDVTLPANPARTIEFVFDPADPFIFLKTSDQFQYGFSVNGYIPFQPAATPTQAAARDVEIFGHIFAGADAQFLLGPLPMQVHGEAVIDFDANDDGVATIPVVSSIYRALRGDVPFRNVFNFFSDFAFGLNGELNMGYDLLGFQLDLPLAQGTFMLQAGSGAFLRAQTDNPFEGVNLDKLIPLDKYLNATLDGFFTITSGSIIPDFNITADVHFKVPVVLSGGLTLTFADEGITVDAILDTFIGKVDVHGAVASNGAIDLTGSIEVGINLKPLAAANARFSFHFEVRSTGISFGASLEADVFVDVLIARGELDVDLGFEFELINFVIPSVKEVTGIVTGELLIRPIGTTLQINVGVQFIDGELKLFLPFPLPDVTIEFNEKPAFADRSVTPTLIQRGDEVLLVGRIVDPDPLDTFELTISWGDGIVETILVPPDPITGTTDGLIVERRHKYEDIKPTGLPVDTYPVEIRWRNPKGGFNSDTFFVTVENSGLLLRNLKAELWPESDGLVALSTEFPHLTGPLTVLIEWGDGTSDLVGYKEGVNRLQELHRYAANGDYEITLTLITEDGVRTPKVPVTVTTVGALPAIAGPNTGVRGHPQTFTLSAPGDGLFQFDLDWDGNGTIDESVFGPSGLAVVHVFPTSGFFNVGMVATGADGVALDRVEHTIQIEAISIEADTTDPAFRRLTIGGTPGNDIIQITQRANGDMLVIMRAGTPPLGQQTVISVPVDGIVVRGQSGNDHLEAKPTVKVLTELFGDADRDWLIGGGGNSILVGGDGDDYLRGGDARDVLIGGLGRDLLYAQGADDLLIGGVTDFDEDPIALRAIMAEWASDRDYLTRIANLRGTGTGPRNNGNVLLTVHGADATVHDDEESDNLIGSLSGLDWFFAAAGGRNRDLVLRRGAGEFVEEVD